MANVIDKLSLFVIGEMGKETFYPAPHKIVSIDKVITCKYCLSHNAISSPTCIRCGAPMGEVE